MKFEAADCLAQRGIIDFDREKINMHMLILTQLKVKSNYPLTVLKYAEQEFHLSEISSSTHQLIYITRQIK